MSEKPKWILRLTLEHNYGPERYVAVAPADHVVQFGNRLADEMRLGTVPTRPGQTSFDAAVEVLQERLVRRDQLEGTARRLGLALTDHLEDHEGWNGEERREKVTRSA